MGLTRSLTARIVPILVLIAIAIAAVLTVASMLFQKLVEDRARDRWAGDSVMLARQMAPGVKWEKRTSIERIYAPFAMTEGATSLSDLAVVTADGRHLVEFRASHFRNFPLSGQVREASRVTSDAPLVHLSTPGHDVFTFRIDEPTSGGVLGYAVFAWDKSALAADIRSINGALTAIGLAAALLISIAVVVISRIQAARQGGKTAVAMDHETVGPGDFELSVQKRTDGYDAVACAVDWGPEGALALRSPQSEEDAVEIYSAADREESPDRNVALRIERLEIETTLITEHAVPS